MRGSHPICTVDAYIAQFMFFRFCYGTISLSIGLLTSIPTTVSQLTFIIHAGAVLPHCTLVACATWTHFQTADMETHAENFTDVGDNIAHDSSDN